MAPLSIAIERATSYTVANAGQVVANDFRSQWMNPSDIFSLLLLVGGDVIQKALAQFSLNRFRPVTFSFGWVAHTFNALLFAVGNLKVLPDPDCPCTLIHTRSGFTLANQSWLLGRLLRNHEYWSKPLIKDAKAAGRVLDDDVDGLEDRLSANEARYSEKAKALYVFVYDAVETSEGRSSADWPYFSGLACTFLQLAVASIPAGLYDEWEILMVTVAGTVLAYATANITGLGTLLRRESSETYVLTEGTGSGIAIIIRGRGLGVDLRSLSSVASSQKGQSRRILVALVQLVLWVSLLITVSGLHTHTWYMVCVGALGMLQNIVLAGAPRTTSSLGIMIELSFVISRPRTMDTLMDLELMDPYSGKALLPIYFPAGLREREQEIWAELEKVPLSPENINRVRELRERRNRHW